jgi:hypothetical protein
MHVSRRVQQMTRRLPTPGWALDDKALGLAALHYCERRLFLKHGEYLTLRERLARVSDAARWAMLPLRKSLTKLLCLYYEWAASKSVSAARLRRLEIQVHNTESTILLLERNLMAVALAVAFSFWRLGWDSVAIAENFKLNPPAVRMMLYRIRAAAEKAARGAHSHR